MEKDKHIPSSKSLLSFLRKHILIVLFVIITLAGIVLDSNYLRISSEPDITEIEDAITDRTSWLSDNMDVFLDSMSNSQSDLCFFDNVSNLFDGAHNEDFVLLFYSNDSLLFWSDNKPVIDDEFSTDLYMPVVFMGNGWYRTVVKEKETKKLVGLILIKREYKLQNPLLKDHFYEGANLNSADYISLDEDEGYVIKDDKGNYLFSIITAGDINSFSAINMIVSLLYFISIIVLLLVLGNWISTRKKLNNLMQSVLYFSLLAIIRLGMIQFEFPEVFKSISLFDPHYFAESEMFSSLGNFLLNSVFLLAAVFFVYKIKIKNIKLSIFNRYSVLSAGILLIFLSLIFGIIEILIQSLIANSTINFEVHKIFDVTFNTFIGFVVISFLILSFILLLDKIIVSLKTVIALRKLILVSTIISLFYLVFSIFSSSHNWISAAFLFVFFISTSFISYRDRKPVYSTLIFYLFILSLFTVSIITQTICDKEDGRKEVIAVNLANERDPLAEAFFEDIENRIYADTVLRDFVFNKSSDLDELYSYVSKNYFSGYWNKYEMEFYLCGENDSIINEQGSDTYSCRDFFTEIITDIGVRIPDCSFSYIDNMNGRISYLGELDITNINDSSQISVFIDLNTVINERLLGYPELLIESTIGDNDLISDYSYAKYKDGVLVTRFGDFEYSLSDDIYNIADNEFSLIKEGGYDHLVYSYGDDITIIVSSVSMTVLDILIMLSYIFVFFHIIFIIVIFLYRFPNQFKEYRFDFKNKIQLTMISILFLSLLLIGGGTVYFNIKQYSNKQLDNISEKIQSVLVEMEHKLADEEELNYDFQEYLTYLLVKFSNVFYSDINIYNLRGDLLASSRGEIFDLSLISAKMNSEAFHQVHHLKKARYVHEEQIGELSYLSVYAPFSNNKNKVLAYLNLPHFTNQKILQEEVFGLITALINIYVFLVLLTILITIFITNRITEPLKLIRDKMNAVRLGKANEKILYNSKDEIGSLIDDYNRMIDELQNSADLLVKSERESAWREMAKQIAHEIKNPLTPMRLQLQHLQKARNENAQDWEERFMDISDGIIKQIDVLSAIATEFSNFAQMPRTDNKLMDLSIVLQETVSLFNRDENDTVSLDLNDIEIAHIYADKEQIQRVLINLIKNALQSVSDGILANVKVLLSRDNENLIIEIKDNGRGVPDELKEKLFDPSFTTKSSGTGLGLAIVNRIITSSGGKVWFTTQQGKGSSFYVSLPEKIVG